jgi:hypothetical protein
MLGTPLSCSSMITHADDFRSTGRVRYGAYFCLQPTEAVRRELEAIDLSRLATRLGLRNEFEPGVDHPPEAVAYLRRVSATPASISDDALLHAGAIIHVAANTAAPVAEFRAELGRRIDSSAVRVLTGVVRPPNYTGTLMHNFAYAKRVLQQPGARMPNAFLMPLSKTAAWWSKSWMERHTYFLPRYAQSGERENEGHALVCEPGIACLMRRTYKQEEEPAGADEYDFINYFECADDDVPVFREVCAGLRDVKRNPEWSFVREGPTWQGRRVATWQELFARV